MQDAVQAVKHLYDRFNARDIDGVLAYLAEDVQWANGMDGGYVQGHSGIREYWTRQRAMVSPHVEPVTMRQADNGSVVVDVRQSVRDLDGNPLEGQTHGLRDKLVRHIFSFAGDKVVRFDIEDVG